MEINLQTILQILIPALTLISTVFIAWIVDQRNAFDRVQKIISEVTTGEIAEQRHKLASFYIQRFPKSAKHIATPQKSRKSKIKDSESTDLCYRIIWALVQVFAVYNSLSWYHKKPKRLLVHSLNSFVVWHLGNGDMMLRSEKGEILSVLFKINDELELRSGDLKYLREKSRDWNIFYRKHCKIKDC